MTRREPLVRFVDKAPISVDESGAIRFVYIDDEGRNQTYFKTHLAEYSDLFAALTVPWTLTLVCWESQKTDGYRKAFERRFLDPSRNCDTAQTDPKLIRYFELSQAVEARHIAKIGKAGVDEHIALRKTYDTPANRTLHADWKSGKSLPIRSTKVSAPCRFETFVPPSAEALLPPKVASNTASVLPR